MIQERRDAFIGCGWLCEYSRAFYLLIQRRNSIVYLPLRLVGPLWGPVVLGDSVSFHDYRGLPARMQKHHRALRGSVGNYSC